MKKAGLVARSMLLAAFTLSPGAVVAQQEKMCRISLSDYHANDARIMGFRDIDALMTGDIIDAPLSVFKRDGKNVWILPTAMQQAWQIYLSHTFVTGDVNTAREQENEVINEHQLFEFEKPGQTFGRHWITNTYQTPDGVLAFMHSEYTGKNDFFNMGCKMIDDVERCAPGVSRISLAWMSNETLETGQYRFRFLGHIAGTASDIPHFNVHGTPYYITRENGVELLNILFADLKTSRKGDTWKSEEEYIAQARSPLADVIAAAKRGQLSNWVKRDGTKWVNALNGTSTGVMPRVPEMRGIDKRIADGNIIVHSDIVYHKPTRSYILGAYLLRQKGRNLPTSILFYRSCDGRRWEFVDRAHPRSDAISGWSYLTLVGRNNEDNGVADGPVDMIIGWEYGKKDRSVYRMKMDIDQNCTCPEVSETAQ